MFGTVSDDTANDEEQRYCRHCGSTRLKRVTEEDRITGLGLFSIYDIPQGLTAIVPGVTCLSCGRHWSEDGD